MPAISSPTPIVDAPQRSRWFADLGVAVKILAAVALTAVVAVTVGVMGVRQGLGKVVNTVGDLL